MILEEHSKDRAPHAFVLPFYDTNIGHWMKQHGSMNPLQSYEMQSILQPGDTVIDVGANLGCYTLPFAERVGAAGKVIAVEPFRWLRQIVASNVAINGLSNVWLPPVGLGAARASFEARPPQFPVLLIARRGETSPTAGYEARRSDANVWLGCCTWKSHSLDHGWVTWSGSICWGWASRPSPHWWGSTDKDRCGRDGKRGHCRSQKCGSNVQADHLVGECGLLLLQRSPGSSWQLKNHVPKFAIASLQSNRCGCQGQDVSFLQFLVLQCSEWLQRLSRLFQKIQGCNCSVQTVSENPRMQLLGVECQHTLWG